MPRAEVQPCSQVIAWLTLAVIIVCQIVWFSCLVAAAALLARVFMICMQRSVGILLLDPHLAKRYVSDGLNYT